MGKDILHRVGNGGHCGCETVSREVLPQVEIPEKWTQEPPCFAITIWCAIKIAHQQERPRAPVVKLSCLQEHVHKKKVLEIVSHHSKYNIFKARNSCIVPGVFSMPLVVLSIGTHVTLAKLYKSADPHMHVKSP